MHADNLLRQLEKWGIMACLTPASSPVIYSFARFSRLFLIKESQSACHFLLCIANDIHDVAWKEEILDSYLLWPPFLLCLILLLAGFSLSASHHSRSLKVKRLLTHLDAGNRATCPAYSYYPFKNIASADRYLFSWSHSIAE